MSGASSSRMLGALTMVAVVVALAVMVFRPGDEASAGIELDDGHGWVEHGIRGEVLRVSGIDGEVTTRLRIAEPGDDLVARAHRAGVAVLNRTNRSVTVVDGATFETVGVFPISASDEEAAAEVLELFSTSSPTSDVVVAASDRLVTIDPETGVSATIAVENGGGSVVQTSDGEIFGFREQDREVRRLTRLGLESHVAVPAPAADASTDRQLVALGDAVHLLDADRLAVSEVLEGVGLGTSRCLTSGARGGVVGHSSGDSSRVVIHNPDAELLSIADLDRDRCFDITVSGYGTNFGAPVAVDNFVYLADYDTGQVEVVDIEAGEVVASAAFAAAGSEFELELAGGRAWVNQPLGPFAAVLEATDLIPVAKIETVVAAEVLDVESDEDDQPSTIGDTGLRIAGDSGDQVVSATADAVGDGAAGEGSEGEGDAQAADGTSAVETVGVEAAPEVDGRQVSEPTSETDLEAPASTTSLPPTSLIANFAISATAVTVDEEVVLTDFSSGAPVSWSWDFGDGNGSTEPNVTHSWSEEGVYIVTLTIRDEAGRESLQAVEVSVVAESVLLPPTADFVFDVSTIEAGESVTFESQTTGEVVALAWDFGDGAREIGDVVTHTFDDVGRFVVTLTASNDAGSTSTSTVITVLSRVEPPGAVIGSLPGGIVDGQTVSFVSRSTNDPTSVQWSFGDGAEATGTRAQHSWTRPGTYRVTLTVANDAGRDSTSVQVVVGPSIDPPVADFTVSATEVSVGEAVTLTSLSTNDPTRLVWRFGDGTNTRGESVRKSWSEPGSYTVTLRAINDAGADIASKTIVVVKPVDPPVAAIGVDADAVSPGTAVRFTDRSSNDPTSWTWNFGDGTTSSAQSPAHAWTEPGDYVVRLTATNEGGSSSTERTITVRNIPSANFRWETSGLAVDFTDTSWNGPESWRWNFGDGNTSTQRSPDHVYEAAGTYDVTLIVSNAVGESEVSLQQVTVAPTPEPVIVCVAEGFRLNCDGSRSENVVRFRWRAADAAVITTAGRATTTFIFDRAGRYDITLVGFNSAGERAEVTIRSPRVAAGVEPTVRSVAVDEGANGVVELTARVVGSPTRWSWTVPGAAIANGNTARPVLTFERNGVYEGTVIASNELGDSAAVTFRITVESISPEAAFTVRTLDQPGRVQLVNESRALPEATFEWRFPDAAEVISADAGGAILQFPNATRNYNVTLIVRDANGTDSTRLPVRIVAVAEPDPDPEPDPGPDPEPDQDEDD